MPKALKISGFTITEIECNDSGSIQDEEYKEQTRSWGSHALYRPEVWGGKKFKLAFVCWDMFTEEDTEYNILGTYIYRMLKHCEAIPDDVICGPVYLMNEDHDGIIDLTIADLKEILEASNKTWDRYRFNLQQMQLMIMTYIAIKIKFPELL